MLDKKNSSKKKDHDLEMSEEEMKSRKRHNSLNRFLNSYFKYFLVLVAVLILLVAIQLLIRPKFNEAVVLSNNVLKEKKSEFINEYQKWQNYEKVIAEFNAIDQISVAKIKKIIPETYSRDDLFTEITYFLISNNYQVKKVEVVSPLAASSLEEGLNLGRRGTAPLPVVATGSDSVKSDLYQKRLSALPDEIGAWVVKVSLSDINYSGLRKMLVDLENNLKLIDIYFLDFQPLDKGVTLEFLTYYYKNN